MLTPSTTNQTQGFCFFKGLPTEIFHEIVSHLTVVELARVQRTCKEWHTEIQKNSKSWARSGPFFEHFRGKGYDENFCQGFEALCKLSKNKLDEIDVHHYVGPFHGNLAPWRFQKLIRAIPKLNPTSLKITCWRTEEHHDELPTILSQCHSLRKLKVDLDEEMLEESHEESPGFLEEHTSVDIHPEKELKLDSLSLNELTLRWWQESKASMRISSSIKTFTLRMLNTDETNIYNVFKFFRHFRQSIESITIFDIEDEILPFQRFTDPDPDNMEIIFPNLIQLNFSHSDHIWDRGEVYSHPRYRFNCPNIQELSIGSNFYWYLFDTTKSLKKLDLTWEVNNLKRILQTFPCIETLQIRLKEKTLRSLIKQVPDQLKYLQVDVCALCKYHATSSLQKYATHHLLDLVKKNNATIQSSSIFRLQREGAAEFCKISVEGLNLTENGLTESELTESEPEDITKFYMCKDNFLQVFTELADTSKETGSEGSD